MISPNASDKSTLLHMLRRMGPYIWPPSNTRIKTAVVATAVCMLLSRIVAVGTPMFLAQAVDELSAPETMILWAVIGLTLAYAGAQLFSAAFQQLRDAIFAPVELRAQRLLAIETFDHIHKLSLSFHLMRKTGALSRIIVRGNEAVSTLLHFTVMSIAPLVIELILIFGVLWVFFSPQYMAIVGVVTILYVVFSVVVSEWRLKLRRKMIETDNNAGQNALDSLMNYETVKYFNAEEHEHDRYEGSMRAYETASLKFAYSLGYLNFGQSFILNAGIATVMVMAAIDVSSGVLSVGDFVLVNSYMLQLTRPLNFLGTVYRAIRRAIVDLGDMFALLDTPLDVEDPEHPLVPEKLTGAIQFEKISFQYEPSRAILQELDITVAAGANVAFVGASGAGKSTIGRLLFRFYDPDRGRIAIDGVNLRDMSQSYLHSVIGVIPQDTVLFNDTIGYNIGYGRIGAIQEEIVNVAKAAQIHEFILSLPQGYDTMVGERGLKLSGGEKQRVAIARMLLKSPKILLLDEATSSLDSKTEQDILESLKLVSAGRTTIQIAHRLSTVQHCDRIYVMEKGKIVEEGTHAQLVASKGHYALLWEKQSTQQNAA